MRPCTALASILHVTPSTRCTQRTLRAVGQRRRCHGRPTLAGNGATSGRATLAAHAGCLRRTTSVRVYCLAHRTACALIRYSPADKRGEKRIFLSSVAVGSYGVGKKGDKAVRRPQHHGPAPGSKSLQDGRLACGARPMPALLTHVPAIRAPLQPPARDAKAPHVLHDTSVDNAKNPSIFVVFHDTQALPAYVLVVAAKPSCPVCKQPLYVAQHGVWLTLLLLRLLECHKPKLPCNGLSPLSSPQRQGPLRRMFSVWPAEILVGVTEQGRESHPNRGYGGPQQQHRCGGQSSRRARARRTQSRHGPRRRRRGHECAVGAFNSTKVGRAVAVARCDYWRHISKWPKDAESRGNMDDDCRCLDRHARLACAASPPHTPSLSPFCLATQKTARARRGRRTIQRHASIWSSASRAAALALYATPAATVPAATLLTLRCGVRGRAEMESSFGALLDYFSTHISRPFAASAPGHRQ